MYTILLNASEISVITGHNKYQNIHDLINNILIRNKLKIGNIKKNTIQEQLNKINNLNILNGIKNELNLKKSSSKTEICDKIIEICIDTNIEITTEEEAQQNLLNTINIYPNIKNNLYNSIYKDLIKKRGIVNEIKSLKKIPNLDNICDILYKKILYEDDNVQIIIQGKLDGMINNKIVVETKNRSKRLFNRIPKYEKVQLECYMFLTNTIKSLHIENYNENSNMIYYDHDRQLWSECKQSIINFIKFIIE